MRTSGASNVLRERAEQANYEAFPSLASGIDGLKEWETNLDKIVSGVRRDSSDHSTSTYNVSLPLLAGLRSPGAASWSWCQRATCTLPTPRPKYTPPAQSRFQFFNNKRTSANTDTGATDVSMWCVALPAWRVATGWGC